MEVCKFRKGVGKKIPKGKGNLNFNFIFEIIRTEIYFYPCGR
jgi:hypothetical protein